MQFFRNLTDTASRRVAQSLHSTVQRVNPHISTDADFVQASLSWQTSASTPQDSAGSLQRAEILGLVKLCGNVSDYVKRKVQ